MSPLETLNKFIKEEHGSPVTLETKWKDIGIDSFGTTMVFCDMDNKYGCYGKEWLNEVDWDSITIEEVLRRIPDEGSEL